jgi:hypothetical protein
MSAHRRLDLPELDAHTAHLDLVIQAAQEAQLAVGVMAHQVAGAVRACPRDAAPGVRHEPRRGELGQAPIAARQTGAGDQQLSCRAERHRLEIRVHHGEAGVGDRPSERHPRAHPRGGRPDRRLGGTVDVPQLEAARQQLGGQLGRQRLAAAQRPGGPRRPPARLDQQPPGGRGRLHRGHLAAGQAGAEPRSVGRFVRPHDLHPAADGERQEDLQPGDVEGERGQRRHHVAAVQTGA